MFVTFSVLLGGVGLFLIGMILMTDGLKAAAGSALQRVLARSTSTPARAFMAGLGITALVQSSSATVVATIGFVSAGLLPFASSIGVIVGASVGTTSTGWIVSLLGLKFSVGAVAFPLIGVGAIMRLLGRGQAAHLGMALAGLGLIFVGIEGLREGMSGVAERFEFDAFSGTRIGGQLALTAIGVGMTVVLQSSSAAVAITLTAVHEGAITLPQAAFLVIGQSIGTTVTAALASIGASVPAKRTAVSQMLFNGVAGTIAFLGASPLLAAASAVAGMGGADDPAISITLFHTSFTIVAALLVMPLLGPFGKVVVRLVRDQVPKLASRLDRSQLELPSAALAAAEATLRDIAAVALLEAEATLASPPRRPSRSTMDEAAAALAETHAFLGQVRMSRDDRSAYARRLTLLHAGEHLTRLVEKTARADLAHVSGHTAPMVRARTAEALALARQWARDPAEQPETPNLLASESHQIADIRRAHRATLLEDTAVGDVTPDAALLRLDEVRRADRLLYHAWRMVHHLSRTDHELQEHDGADADDD